MKRKNVKTMPKKADLKLVFTEKKNQFNKKTVLF